MYIDIYLLFNINFTNLSGKVDNIWVFMKLKSTALVNEQKIVNFKIKLYLLVTIIGQAIFFT